MDVIESFVLGKITGKLPGKTGKIIEGFEAVQDEMKISNKSYDPQKGDKVVYLNRGWMDFDKKNAHSGAPEAGWNNICIYIFRNGELVMYEPFDE